MIISKAFWKKYERYGWDGVYMEAKATGYTRSLSGMIYAAKRLGLREQEKQKAPRRHDRRYPELRQHRTMSSAAAGDIVRCCPLSFLRKDGSHLFTLQSTDVYFEKEGIYTFDSKGELLITILSSLAKEESRSISENVTWGQRKRFAAGKVTLPYKSFLGYRKGPDGLPEIVPEEAEIIREIYRLFVQGKTVNWIATRLTGKGISTPRGKEKWQTSTIESILTHKTYKGSAVLQKKFTVDFLSKKMKVNLFRLSASGRTTGHKTGHNRFFPCRRQVKCTR